MTILTAPAGLAIVLRVDDPAGAVLGVGSAVHHGVTGNAVHPAAA